MGSLGHVFGSGDVELDLDRRHIEGICERLPEGQGAMELMIVVLRDVPPVVQSVIWIGQDDRRIGDLGSRAHVTVRKCPDVVERLHRRSRLTWTLRHVDLSGFARVVSAPDHRENPAIMPAAQIE